MDEVAGDEDVEVGKEKGASGSGWLESGSKGSTSQAPG